MLSPKRDVFILSPPPWTQGPSKEGARRVQEPTMKQYFLNAEFVGMNSTVFGTACPGLCQHQARQNLSMEQGGRHDIYPS